MAETVDTTRRIVVLGKTGCGKSSTANTILGEKLFDVGKDAKSTTPECKKQEKIINGKKITLIDTPGFFDTREDMQETIREELPRCITMCSPGVHTFLILLPVGVYTYQEEEIVKKITDTFSEEALKYAVVLFTLGDQLDDGEKIKNFVKTNKKLENLVKKCGGRCHVIDNKYWNQSKHEYRSNSVQVEKLLNTIEEMIRKNGGDCYTNAMLQAVEAAIQGKVEASKENNLSGMTMSESRQRAEEEVSWEIRAAGLATGALLGALLGIPVVIVACVVHTAKALPCLLQVLKKMSATSEEVAGTLRGGAGAVCGIGVPGTVAAVAKFTSAGVACGAVTAGIIALGGAVAGGYEGYQAAEEAKSPGEAVRKAAEAVKDEAWKIVFGTNQADYKKLE